MKNNKLSKVAKGMKKTADRSPVPLSVKRDSMRAHPERWREQYPPIRWRDKIIVFGTMDALARYRFNLRWVYVEHPTDKGFFKVVRILKKNFNPAIHYRTVESLK